MDNLQQKQWTIPKAKKNLHACRYHLVNMWRSVHPEELQYNFAAFLSEALRVTWVLQNEYCRDKKFIKWWGNIEKDSRTGGNKSKLEKGTKRYEMRNDQLCSFFYDLRTKILKEGVSGFAVQSTKILKLDTRFDIKDKPEGASSFIFSGNGAYWLIYPSSSKVDMIPAKFQTTANIQYSITSTDLPNSHLNKLIKNNNLLKSCELYCQYLSSLLEEWTEILNKHD